MTLTSSDAFSDITSLLSVGKADNHGGPKIKQLKEEHKFGVVIDLDDRKREAQEAKKTGLKYIGKKTAFIPTPSALEELSKIIDREVKAGNRVYVHCHKGIYRSPTVAVAYLIYKGMKTDSAISRVKKRRPSALPGIENSQHIVPALRTFEEQVRAQKSSES